MHGCLVYNRYLIIFFLSSDTLLLLHSTCPTWALLPTTCMFVNINVLTVERTLGDEFREIEKTGEVVAITDDIDYKQYSKVVKVAKGEAYILQPGHCVLGITEEVITLSPGHCGLLEGRSRFARMGLAIHITAGFMQPGINNRQVLEIYNVR